MNKELETRIVELDNRRNQLDNKLSKAVEELRADVASKYVDKAYFDVKYESLLDKVSRFEKVASDIVIVMSDFNAHRAKVTALEVEIGKLERQIDLVDARNETRHEKIMDSLETGLGKIQGQLDNRGNKFVGLSVGVIATVATILNIIYFISQHVH